MHHLYSAVLLAKKVWIQASGLTAKGTPPLKGDILVVNNDFMVLKLRALQS